MAAIADNACTEADLLAAAGQRSFDRGSAYLDAVDDVVVFGNQVTASVRGTDEYIVMLTMGGSAGVTGVCDCPYGKEGFFCKHCVAVGLAFLRDARNGRNRRAESAKASRSAAGGEQRPAARPLGSAARPLGSPARPSGPGGGPWAGPKS